MLKLRRIGIGVGLAVGMIAPAWGQAPRDKLSPEQQVVQALNRLTWGIKPGEVAAVEKLGLKTWLRQQLHPHSIPENPELTAALEPLASLRMTPAEMMASYPPPLAILQMARGRRPLPTDPKLRGVVETEIEVARLRMNSKNGAPAPGRGSDEPVVMSAPPLEQFLSADQVQALESGPMPDRLATLEGLPQAMRQQVLASLPRRSAQQLAPWLPLGQERELAYFLMPQQVTNLDLLGAKVLRAVYSKRQLEDVLTDFWFNHFNVFIGKGQDRTLVTSYERDAIRPHVLGKFRDLLLATAESPAMLFYLDNWQSVDPKVNQRGINENYGREVMELHTLGVDGGYTQKDVTEVARCFTGWTIRQPLRQATFFYNDRLHDHGAKVVLGVKIPAGGGMSDGLKVMDILARSPATAHHISYELAQRFVADDPPPALVDRMAATFLRTDGDLRQVMETMIHTPEFWQPTYFRDKVKSPLETVVSSVRALGADVSNPTRLTQIIAAMGQPLYAKQPPRGYRPTGGQWAADLTARLNFVEMLAANRIPGVQVDLTPFAPASAPLATVEQNFYQALLQDHVSANIQTQIAQHMATVPGLPPAKAMQIAALVLGSPDFQKH
ncbi:MAG TPA: DUF1800 domain-containing protein [Terriglobales bacterium]|nr:DUF1800 domain-containing protein [Terriglobales bacterium]